MFKKNILHINPQIVSYIISKAKEFHSLDKKTRKGKDKDIDIEKILENHPEDHSYIEAKLIIDDLPLEQIIDLHCLIYIGRGDFDKKNWDNIYHYASTHLADNVTDFIFSNSNIVDDLKKGFEALGYS